MRLDRKIFVLLIAILTGGCQSLTVLASSLGDALDRDAPNQARLDIDESATSAPRYRPLERCSYDVTVTRPSGRFGEDLDVTIRPVRNRLLVTLRGESGISTALIDHKGRLFDSNPASRLGRMFGRDVNPMSLLFPHYRSERLSVGESAASIMKSADRRWGTYVYRGISSHGGKRVLVLDILRPGPNGQGRRWAGYNLVDAATALPAVVILNDEAKLQLRHRRCR